MSDRATHLQRTAEHQISELTALLAGRDRAELLAACPGREKLGDGSIAACAQLTADNYLRIVGAAAGHRGGHRVGRHSSAHGSGDYRADAVDLRALRRTLSRARGGARRLGELSDEQLDSVPAADESVRFLDGRRTLEQVLAGMLTHQHHQLDAIAAGLRATGLTGVEADRPGAR